MMGFSVIFPIFPETLKFFLNGENDFVLEFLLRLSGWIGKSTDPGQSIIIFGGVVGSIYSILQFIFAPVWGKLSDKTGRKPILLFTSLGNLVGYLIWFFSTSFTLFILSRIVTGSMGGNISVASASMADTTSGKDRAKGMGIIGAGIGLGFILGPPLGGLMAGIDLRQSFLVSGLPGVTIFSSSALLSVFVALINLFLILFLFRETLIEKGKDGKREIHPIFGMFGQTSRKIANVSLIYFLFTLSFSGFEFSINFFMHQVLGFSPKAIGLSFVYIGFIIILIQGGVIRRISGIVSEKKILIAGTIILIAGYSILTFAKSVSEMFLSLTFLSIGSALLNPGLSALTSLYSGAGDQGRNLGIMRSAGALARGIAPIAFCILHFKFGPNFSFLVSLLISFLFFYLVYRLESPSENG
ncbi:MAG: MFS transporter [Leptospira sp.]|nr:MFS transporter [Leptospira sp.]